MRFSIIVQLYLHFLFYQQVSSAFDLFLKNIVVEENILQTFFRDLQTVYLEKCKPRHITILGNVDNYFQHVQSLLSYPIIICTDTKKCAYQEEFNGGNVVIVFLDDLDGDKFAEKIEFLSLCKGCKILFISDGKIGINEIQSIFILAIGQNLIYVKFAHLHENDIKLYNYFVAKNCSIEVQLVSVWTPDTSGKDKIRTWAFQLLKNLNGCPVSVSSLNFKPKMVIEETNNGSLMIAGGLEGRLLLALAETVNFTPVLTYPSMVNRMKYSRKASIVNEVISGIGEIGIGRIRPTNEIHELLSFSVPYDEECVTWGVPHLVKWSDGLVLLEFSWQVWVLIGLAFAIACIIAYVDQNMYLFKQGKRNNRGFCIILLDGLAAQLGNPVVFAPSSAQGRLILMAYIYYALVITTAYKSSFAAILSTYKATPLIINVEDIINANIMLGGSLYDYNILKDQLDDNKFNSKLLERFVVNNNDSETMHQLIYDHDYAFLARISSFNYRKQKMISNRESITFNTINGCVLGYHPVIIYKKTSLLMIPINWMILRLAEVGFLVYWDSDKIYTEQIVQREVAAKNFEKQTIHRFQNMFILYFSCLALCSVIFIIELILGKFNRKKKISRGEFRFRYLE